MSRIFIFIVFIFCSIIVAAQSNYEIVTDSASGSKIMLGQCKKIDFENELCSGWFYEEFNNYHPDSATVALLKEHIPASGIIFLGTWCSDSRREVPRFFKIVELAGWCPDNFEVYCLDHKKMLSGIDVASYKIELVPTFIFYDGDTELGRIIETPQTSIEGDLLKIISN